MTLFTLKLLVLGLWFSATFPPLFALAFFAWVFGDHDE